MTGEPFTAYRLEMAVPPDPRFDLHLVRRPADDVEAVCLAEPVGSGPTEAWGGAQHERRPEVVRQHLERVSLHRRGLMNVPAEDQVDAGGGKRAEHRVAVLERELPGGAPRGAGEVVVERDDPQRTGRGARQDRPDGGQALRAQLAALMTPGTARVEAADDGIGGAGNG